MPTVRSFQCLGFVTASNAWDTHDSGDAIRFFSFVEGGIRFWQILWQGYYQATFVQGAVITVTLGAPFYEAVPDNTGPVNPFVSRSQAYIQALIDTPGVTVQSVSGGIGGSAPGAAGYTTIPPAPPISSLTTLVGAQWQVTRTGLFAPLLTVDFASGTISLLIPDTQTVEITGEGGMAVQSVPGNPGPRLRRVVGGNEANPGGLAIGSAPGSWGGTPTIQLVDHSGECSASLARGSDSGGGSGCQEPSA